jgi:hypothetical protein
MLSINAIDDINAMKKLTNMMNNTIKKQKTLNNKQGLDLMKKFMETEILPFLSQFNNAKKYVKYRNKKNKKTLILMKHIHKLLLDEFKDLNFVSIKIMSSINAKLNLAENDSDVDFGIIIDGLNIGDHIDMAKYTQVVEKLINLKFKFTNIFNPTNINNQYFSFEKKINNIEFECKIRDLTTSKTIMKLHDFLDNNLTNEQITLFTYAKYLCKKYNKKTYDKFKKILYEWAFSHIKGGFVMNF